MVALYLHDDGQLVGPRSLLQQKVLMVQRIQKCHEASRDPSQPHPLKGIVQLVLSKHVARIFKCNPLQLCDISSKKKNKRLNDR